MLTGNKGEWSEIYVLLKLLGDTRIYMGDSELNKISSFFFPIIKILRNETSHQYEYSLSNHVVIINENNIELFRISVSEFKNKAEKLLHVIKISKGVFQVPELEKFLEEIKCSKLKAKSTVKTDIRIMVHDLKTNQTPVLGFSIKSQLGGSSTLLNAGKTTNFIYKIIKTKLSDNIIHEINIIKNFNNKLDKISSYGGKLDYCDVDKGIFKNNLILIDSLLPNILSETLLNYYKSKESKIYDLSNKLNEKNPLDFDNQYNHSFYEYKIKRFLVDIALGMMPSKVWNGRYDATGGYLIVKDDGEILCYHLYDRNEFEDYLFKNTKFDTASTSRHDFGEIYKKNDELFIKLNMQIRFLK